MNASISEALHGLVSSYRTALKTATTNSGIELAITHIRAIKCISKIPNCSARDIAQKLHLDKSQIARLLKDLLQQDYISKDKHPTNRRCQSLNLTDKGYAIYAKIQQIDQQNRQRMCQNIAESELEQFIALANRMKQNLTSPTQSEGALS
ncbi:MarR family transcriptional regulator [Marinomonas sp. THO17]|uniref:MarR family winged helix-turn-helix transcriptional regulator n=1 Tax=Marinomonas sp. THO17 TaxID=3149048 RepID=UPI00336C072A